MFSFDSFPAECIVFLCSAAVVLWFVYPPRVHTIDTTRDSHLINTVRLYRSALSLCLRYHQHQHHHRGHRRLDPRPRPHYGCDSLVLQVSFSTPIHVYLLDFTLIFILMKCATNTWIWSAPDKHVSRKSLLQFKAWYVTIYWYVAVCACVRRSYKQRRYVESEVHRRFCRFDNFNSDFPVLLWCYVLCYTVLCFLFILHIHA